MHPVIEVVAAELNAHDLCFSQKPLLIGGRAMEFYGLRPSGPDMDLIICDADYQVLAQKYPNKRKDIYGDLGVILWPLEIWRSIACLDYAFLSANAQAFETLMVVSLERLMLLRVCALEHKKYRDDLELIKQHYYTHFRNDAFSREAETHLPAYEKNNYVVWGGNYEGE